MVKYLTKSRFKLGLECPTKLFYTGKKEYVDVKLQDEFLRALAEGGFQVGELAKIYYPKGINIDELDHNKALEITKNLLKAANVTIFEAAFSYQNLFIRTDILVKNGNDIRLVEVKSKSYDPNTGGFIGARGGISGEWKPYIYDVSFQKFVLKNSHPDFNVHAYLCLADKSQRTSVEGLNQNFFIYQEGNRTKVRLSNGTPELGNKILIEVSVDDIVDKIINGEILIDDQTLEQIVAIYADGYQQDKRISHDLHSGCKTCEFTATKEQLAKGYKSGFRECWQAFASFKEEDFEKPLVLNIWDLRKKDEFISLGKYFMEQITRNDLEGAKMKEKPKGLSRVDRQFLQVEKAATNDTSHYIDVDGLKSEMDTWHYPLHFIDFETTAVAIPFNSGRRPYEQIAFQFSHHIVYEDGRIEHNNEWINTERGIFPNYQFVRELKKSLGSDSGSIFRYSHHENTILNTIYAQLQDSSEVDKELLCDWIRTITKSKSSSEEKWEGKRNMIDLLDMVKKYYYNPLTNGSNSLKYVLPAILNSSDYLKIKYSKPIYGSTIRSHNYRDQVWIVPENGGVKNPYELLPPIIDGYNNELLDTLVIDEESGIADGGAAMIAYARMQFTEMSNAERKQIAKALLRYCELDTFAMVLLWEAWNNWCNEK